ncbi:molybdenum cofactor biosynthesis protein C [Metarhizium guizhouense ARSEF 977]|uniref:Molybdenum cofactor biosynthesis protein C n=1 Tax=Metarhizium guizhouense (strain ARSEF 977) TaxID=1276136 RepID=A0A0B4H250_METGA|nr:molybdenum cofactor biosynthesis protein C [Metarhizium guizhouense ARSEF 977]
MDSSSFKPVLLAGGKATRMGEPKHLLSMGHGSTLLQHPFDLLHEVCPSEKVYISLAQESPPAPLLGGRKDAAKFIYDSEPNDSSESAGPAAGIIAAHRADPGAVWLVVACDYPLLTTEALRYVCEAYSSPVTCFRNTTGYCEPLVGVCSPLALEALEKEVANGARSPAAVVKKLDGRTVSPPLGCENWLFNVNTKNDWRRALELLEARRNEDISARQLHRHPSLGYSVANDML